MACAIHCGSSWVLGQNVANTSPPRPLLVMRGRVFILNGLWLDTGPFPEAELCLAHHTTIGNAKVPTSNPSFSAAHPRLCRWNRGLTQTDGSVLKRLSRPPPFTDRRARSRHGCGERGMPYRAAMGTVAAWHRVGMAVSRVGLAPPIKQGGASLTEPPRNGLRGQEAGLVRRR